MKHIKAILVTALIGLSLIVKTLGAPTSVGGDIFTLVATNSGGTQLYSLTADDQGIIYAGNNSQGPGIPLQRFVPASFAGTVGAFTSFGPVCNDGDGLAYGGGYLYAPDTYNGIRKINSTNGVGTIFNATVGLSPCGSPVAFRPSDGHLFTSVGCRNSEIQEYDPAGQYVTNYITGIGVQTMAFDALSGVIYYATYGADVHAYDLSNRTDSFVATVDGAIDGGLAVDRISNRLFVGTANGANQGRVYSIDLTTHAVTLFASGFDGCLGILREQISGDLYFLEANNLYRLQSTNVVFSPKLFIWPAVELGWLSDTNQMYQIQWATGLDTNSWTDFGPPVQGNGTTNFLFDTTRTSPKRFYRVIVVP